MLYPSLFKQMEEARWSLSQDIPWNTFDRSQLTERQAYGIKMNALLEWSAMPTAEMFLRDNQEDVDFAAFISVWFFEEQKHSLVFLEYLRQFAPEFAPTQEELSEVRFQFDSAPIHESLALHFCGEVRLNQWYRCAVDYHTEPLIKHIYGRLAADEARHAQAYFSYMKKALNVDFGQASRSFIKIGILMCNSRLNKAMHPTNLHVNKELYPRDSVNSRLPDTNWLGQWLDDEICFDEAWEKKVERGILGNYSSLFGKDLSSVKDIRRLRAELFRVEV